MRLSSIIASVAFACTTSPARANDLRVPSPDRRFVAVYHYSVEDAQLVERISFTDSSGHVLFTDDYAKRDYRPEKGQWTRSGRFFVYSLHSGGGHSPRHQLTIDDVGKHH
jgi:hypothetical protein